MMHKLYNAIRKAKGDMKMFAKGADPRFKRHAVGIIILGCLAMYFSCCLASDALNIIQPAFTEKMGWSYSSVSLPFTIANFFIWCAADEPASG